jgi:D-glycero-alpha-D-manno-heptose-7-phosphate kinase
VTAPLALLASAPTRLDFGGGWTDVPPYPQERGGFVCAVAIERRATVTLRLPTPSGTLRDDTNDLVRAALRRARAEELQVSLQSDFPVGAGLGGSSAAGVALAAGLAAWQERVLTPSELAEASRDVEVNELGIAGGRQDHYAAAYGGALALRFGEQVEVQPIALSEQTRADLESRCLVVYTGESRISGTTIRAVLDAYLTRDPHVVLSLDRMASLAQLMSAALVHADLESLGALVGEHWIHQRSLHAGITTPRIDTLISRALSAGALGAKPLGASGGGCVLIVCARDRVPDVSRAIDGLGEALPFRVATHGVHVAEIE